MGTPPATDMLDSSTNMKSSNSEMSVHLESVPPSPPQETRESFNPDDPQNWPKWRKNTQILMVAAHSMVATFMAAGIIPAYDAMAEEYGVSVPAATYLTSLQILFLGIAPFFWKPITNIYGRHHILIFSVLGSMVCNIGGARCTTYGAQMATRILTGIIISPPIGIASGIITELSEPGERAQKLGWWTLLLTIGTPFGPFIMGFVVQHAGVQYIYWIFAILNFIQLLGYLFFGAETMRAPEIDGYDVPKPKPSTGLLAKFLPRRIDRRPLTMRELLRPLSLARYPRITIPAIAHSIVFSYANIALIVEMPIAFGQKFHFNAQQIGLQFIAIIIGCFLGEQLSGPMSDWFLRTLDRRKGGHIPADRLWLSYIGFGTVFAGLLVWGFQLDKATSWNVTPCIGAAIASFGNQICITILVSFAVDSYSAEASNVGVCINMFRQIWGFIAPFYLPLMFENLKLAGAAGVMCGIVAGAAMLPIIAVQFVASRSKD
ncbi:putative MFS transporter [Aspergillus clavatus NRRL 1]|uniref:MFS transporter, putative n=1 Tax=Aspergillus clavatus (strain ATCC 1007 / CBS 513.65 / DSM 816 / NCTC 3887 / NRRL 1 / QM 1276 / 107) TaxID=344612 RepID=A1CNA6_ASPCL|nr:MFS transporter, putative [Aspergillus clavatus NRRL 1]EAW07127.1 MFS transporter, putative [Aspergillus clavatus NRRL 1]